MSNAVKHAGATEVRVRVGQEGRCAHVSVTDDGAGGASVDEGTGLLGLGARIEALGGTLTVDSPRRRRHAPGRDDPARPMAHAARAVPRVRLRRRRRTGRAHASPRCWPASARSRSSLAREWDLEGGPPRPGQVLPVVDHHGRRHGDGRGRARGRRAVRPGRRGRRPGGRAGRGRLVDAWRERSGASTRAAATRWPCCSASRAGASTGDEPMVITGFRVISG